MPVMPSFKSFAPTPDLAGAWLGGRASSQRDRQITSDIALQSQKLAQDAAQAEQAIAMSQQKLQQEAVQSQMEMQAKQAQLQQESMRAEQELRIKQQYQQQQIGIKQQQAKTAADTLKIKTNEASRKLQFQNAYQTKMRELVDKGMTPQEAASQSMMEFGPMLGIGSSAMSKAIIPPKVLAPDLGEASDVPGMDPSQFKRFRTSEGAYSLVPMPQSMGESTPAGYVRDGRYLKPERESLEIKNTREAIKSLERQQMDKVESAMARSAEMKLDKKAEIPDNMKKILEVRKNRQAQIDALKQKLPEYSNLEQPEDQPSQELGKGEAIHTLKNGRKAVFKDKEFIRYAD